MRSILATRLCVVVASIVMVGTIHAGEIVRSGPAVGDPASPFDVDDVTGPNKGTTLCYR